MNSLCRKKHTSKFLTCLIIVALTYIYLLVMSYGFPVTGDDWFFTTRFQNEGFLEAIKRGITISWQHAISLNGRYFGNALSGIFGCSDILREVFRCAIILGIILAVGKFCKVRDIYLYLITLILVIALPASIFSQTYAWAAGFFNYVPPVLFLLLFLVNIAPLYEEKPLDDKWYHAVALFLIGIGSQFFVENITVAVCLLSVTIFLGYLIKYKKFSWKLVGYLLGTLFGGILMFLSPGYRRVGVDGYREVPRGIKEMFTTAVKNFSVVSKYVTEDNWLIIGILTILCLYLLYKIKAQNQKEKHFKLFGFTALCIPVLYFYIYQNILARMTYRSYVLKLTFVLDVFANAVYLLGILLTVKFSIKDKKVQNKAFICIISILFLIMPLFLVSPIGPRCFYITYILMTCLVIQIINYIRDTYLKDLTCCKIPIILGTFAILLAYLWVMVWNGHAETLRVQYTEEQIQKHATEIVLPSYPYPEFIHGGNSPTIEQYYFYKKPGDIKFVFIPYEKW